MTYNSETSDSPNIKIGYRDSCCNTINVLSKGCKTINVLTKEEEQENLLINMISQIDNPELKEEYLKKLKKTTIKCPFGKNYFCQLILLLAYFCYYSWVSLHFLVLFMGFTVLFQLTFIFITVLSAKSFHFQ